MVSTKRDPIRRLGSTLLVFGVGVGSGFTLTEQFPTCGLDLFWPQLDGYSNTYTFVFLT